MKIWLDDQMSDPESPKRWPPEEFIGVRNLAELKKLLERNLEEIEVMDFDHDLGDFDENDEEITGYDIIKWMTEHCLDRWPKIVLVHSTNPAGVKNILEHDTFVRRRLLP